MLANDDLTLQAPALRVDGSGRVNLPKRTVNYRLEPTAAATLKGQGGKRDVAGLLVPVIIKGPWDDLTYTPDLTDIARRALEDPEALQQQLEGLGDQADGIKDALKDRASRAATTRWSKASAGCSAASRHRGAKAPHSRPTRPTSRPSPKSRCKSC